MRSLVRSLLVLGLAATTLSPAAALAAPAGEMSWAVHVTLAPRWLDPGETESAITPFMVLYALHVPIYELAFLWGHRTPRRGGVRRPHQGLFVPC